MSVGAPFRTSRTATVLAVLLMVPAAVLVGLLAGSLVAGQAPEEEIGPPVRLPGTSEVSPGGIETVAPGPATPRRPVEGQVIRPTPQPSPEPTAEPSTPEGEPGDGDDGGNDGRDRDRGGDREGGGGGGEGGGEGGGGD